VEPAVRSLPDWDPAVAPTPAPEWAADADAPVVSDAPVAVDEVADPQDRSTRVPRYVIVFI